eukprot:TRINITY_DN510_c0_g1_i2.p2 TRINITY_DN510_c0_g1~~TRINITY_DN510_c0_g1_i2.p2  ORF type:complete len:295 (-),score=73.57 TRINITY_DN510_c0_g1_i2:68-952(-)
MGGETTPRAEIAASPANPAHFEPTPPASPQPQRRQPQPVHGGQPAPLQQVPSVAELLADARAAVFSSPLMTGGAMLAAAVLACIIAVTTVACLAFLGMLVVRHVTGVQPSAPAASVSAEPLAGSPGFEAALLWTVHQLAGQGVPADLHDTTAALEGASKKQLRSLGDALGIAEAGEARIGRARLVAAIAARLAGQPAAHRSAAEPHDTSTGTALPECRSIRALAQRVAQRTPGRQKRLAAALEEACKPGSAVSSDTVAFVDTVVGALLEHTDAAAQKHQQAPKHAGGRSEDGDL